jgi:hypothetical protein
MRAGRVKERLKPRRRRSSTAPFARVNRGPPQQNMHQRAVPSHSLPSNSPALELNGSRGAATRAGEVMICLQPANRFSVLLAALWAVERDLSIVELGLRCRVSIQGDPNEEVAQRILQHRTITSRRQRNMIQ